MTGGPPAASGIIGSPDERIGMSDASPAARLVAKLGDLNLEDDEATLLATVFRQAAEAGGPEVEGFAMPSIGKDPFAGGFDTKSHSKPFKGTDEELQAIVDWLGSLEAQK